MRFQVVSRSCYAPKSGGGRYRHPVRVLVVDAKDGIKPAYRQGDPTVRAEWKNVDSRYCGPRSEHGQALAAARQLAEELNAQALLDTLPEGNYLAAASTAMLERMLAELGRLGGNMAGSLYRDRWEAVRGELKSRGAANL